MSESVRKSLPTLALLAIILLMGIEIIYLVRQNRQLRAELERSGQPLAVLQRNDQLPPVHALSVQNDSLKLTYSPDDPYTLLFLFSPSCEACDKNIGFWNSLARERQADWLRIVAFSSGSLAEAGEFLARNEFVVPTLAVTDESLLAPYKGDVVPQTVLISPVGVVLKSWPGSLDAGRQLEIVNMLDSLNTELKSGRR
jgi:hypothetical protein